MVHSQFPNPRVESPCRRLQIFYDILRTYEKVETWGGLVHRNLELVLVLLCWSNLRGKDWGNKKIIISYGHFLQFLTEVFFGSVVGDQLHAYNALLSSPINFPFLILITLSLLPELHPFDTILSGGK